MSTSKKLTIAEQLKIKKKKQQSAFLQTASLSKKEMGLTGFEDEWTKRLIIAQHYLKKSNVVSLRPILPALLQLKGKPYHLNDHFPFEPFFRTRMPYMTLLKTGRQVSKSTSLSSQGIIFSNAIPYFSTLYVTPLYEMVRRFSHNYVRQFIETSPVKRLFMNSKTINSVLQRSFRNGSTMYFSFAYLDAERTRGIPADKNVIDEVQEMNYDFLSIIHETLSGSPFGLKQYAGTPKSLENTIEKLWTDSSQAEFAIKCHHGGCNYWNVPALSHDLVKMIGPWHSGISEQCPGIVCAKCRKPIDPRRNGRWIHAQPNVRWSFAGYHVPQIIMPMHYATPKKWDMLVGKMQGRGNTPMNVFFNEVCGESYDVGSKLVTVTELQAAACLPWENKIEQAEKHLDQYLYKILAVDWGGGGGKLRNSAAKPGSEQRERTSYTVLVVMGMRPDGKIDVIWGLRSLRTHAHVHEAELCIAAIQRFKCSHFVHDFNGAGAIRETLVRQAGFPMGNIIPIAYHASAKKNIMVHKPPTDDLPRDWWTVDKSRSLQLTCELIKSGQLRFFKDDYRSSDDAGLIRDFLALIEEKTERPSGGDVYCITRNPTASDDFAQGVNIGCCALFQLSGQWPDVAAANHLILPLDVLSHVHPQHQPDWDDAGS